MERRNYVAASGAVVASIAGCLELDSGDDDSNGNGEDGTASATSVIEQFYDYLDNDPDPSHVDELFHSESPTAETWRQIFSNTSEADGDDVVDTSASVSVEDPSESELQSEIGFAVDDQTFQSILDIVNDAEDSAIVEIDVELDSDGEQTEETDLWVVATEDGEWRIVW